MAETPPALSLPYIQPIVSQKWWKLKGSVISGSFATHPTGGANRQGDGNLPNLGGCGSRIFSAG